MDQPAMESELQGTQIAHPTATYGSGWEVPLQCQWELRTSVWASSGFGEAHGKGHLLHCHLLTLWFHQCCGGGGTTSSLCGGAQRRGSTSALHVGGRGLEEGGADSPALWTPVDMWSTNQLAGVPTMANSSSWSPSHSRCAA